MKREYRVLFITPLEWTVRDCVVRLSVMEGKTQNTVELLLLAQARHEIGAHVGRPPDQVRISSFSLLSEYH